MKKFLISCLIATTVITSSVKLLNKVDGVKPIDKEELVITYFEEFDNVAKYKMENGQGDVIKVLEDDNKDYYELSYTRNGREYKYHVHSQTRVDDMIKIHQKDIYENFENWEDLGDNYFLKGTIQVQEFERLRAKEIVNGLIGETDKKNKLVRSMENDGKYFYGIDVEKGINYYNEYGMDWKCYKKPLISKEEFYKTIEEITYISEQEREANKLANKIHGDMLFQRDRENQPPIEGELKINIED